jgi:ArsR family transcriptional regulator, arsenate/arsenite/antimonite-responsive transcriptional repressor
MKEFIRVMKALSDPSREIILKMLQQRMLCVCEIQAALDIAQSTTSKHLKLLENAGIVRGMDCGLTTGCQMGPRANMRPNRSTALSIG